MRHLIEKAAQILPTSVVREAVDEKGKCKNELVDHYSALILLNTLPKGVTVILKKKGKTTIELNMSHGFPYPDMKQNSVTE